MVEKIFAVNYVYDPSRSEDLARIRPDHRVFLRSLYESGSLLASGPFGDGEALIVVRADDSTKALELLDPDPLHAAGVILSRTATEWNPVISPWAAQ